MQHLIVIGKYIHHMYIKGTNLNTETVYTYVCLYTIKSMSSQVTFK